MVKRVQSWFKPDDLYIVSEQDRTGKTTVKLPDTLNFIRQIRRLNIVWFLRVTLIKSWVFLSQIFFQIQTRLDGCLNSVAARF